MTTRRAVVVLGAALALSCGGGGTETCEPAEPRVELRCPEAVELGCVPAAGAVASFEPVATSCEGSRPEVECSPASGSVFGPGETVVACTARSTSGAAASCALRVLAEAAGSFALDCPAAAWAECAGALTAVALEQPGVEPGCGAPAGPARADAPEAGFPPGETLVTFVAPGEAGFEARCTTSVLVEDTVGPELACPASTTLVRTSAGLGAEPPPLEARDLCDGAVPAVPDPATLGRGSATVRYSATDRSGNAARCEAGFEVLDGFAVEGLRILSARLGPTGTSIALGWEPSGGADATGYRVERGPTAAGPFSPLGSVALGGHTFVDPALPGETAYYRVVTLAGSIDGGASPALRARAVAAAAYDLRGQRVPTVPFATTLYGVVRHPADLGDGPFPLVLLLHGNHGTCRPSPFTRDDECATTDDHDCPWSGYTTTPNAEGLAYLAETLAAQGYVAATLSGNALNCRDDHIVERAELVIEHLRRWAAWSGAGGPPFGATFAGAVDMTRVGLVGHSRGGEAVAVVPGRLAASPVAGVSLASVFSIAPTDYHAPEPAGPAYAVLLPSCDGDVWTLAGMHIYDRARDPAAGRPRAQVFYVGANHNFFSSEWHYDDNRFGLVCATRDEVGGPAQKGMLEATLGAWMNGTVPAGALPEAFLRAEAATPACIDEWAGVGLDLRWSYSAPFRTVVDDFSGPGAPETNLLGLPNVQSGFTLARACFEDGCDANFWHQLDALMLSWDAGAPLAVFHLGGIDARARPFVSFRMTSRRSLLNSELAEQDLVVRLVDGRGTAVEVLVGELTRVPHLYPATVASFQREVLQSVRVPLSELADRDAAFDPASLARLELEMTAPGHARGSILVTDLDLSE